MSNNRLVIASVILIGLVGLMVMRMNAREADRGAPAASSIELPEIDKDAIDELELSAPDKPKVVLKKQGDSWRVVEPVDAVADDNAVTAALAKLDELEVTGLAATQAKNQERLEVSADTGTHVIARAGGKPLLDAYVGTYRSGNTMLRLEGQEQTATVKGSIRYAFNKEVREWRERSVVKVEADAVSAIELHNEHGDLRFAKDGDNWTQVVGKGEKAIDPFDGSKVKSILGTATSLNTTDFATADVTPEQAGLAEGAAIFRMTVDGSDAGVPQSIELRLGKTQDKNVYLMKVGDPQIYLVSTYIAGRLKSDPKTFEKKPESDTPSNVIQAQPSGPPTSIPGLPPGMQLQQIPGH